MLKMTWTMDASGHLVGVWRNNARNQDRQAVEVLVVGRAFNLCAGAGAMSERAPHGDLEIHTNRIF